MLTDPALGADYKKRNLDFQPLGGKAIETKIREAFKSAIAEVMERLQHVLVADK